jgi:hypothetical protein
MLLMAGYFVPVNFLAAATLALVTPLVLTFSSTVALGVVAAAGGLGAVMGSLLMVVWGGTARRAIGMIGALVPAGIGTVVVAVATTPVAAAVGLFLWWAATSVLNAHWISILQLKVGTELLGRVLSVNQMLATAMMPLGFLTAPWAVEHLVPLLSEVDWLGAAAVESWRRPGTGGAAALLLTGCGLVLLVWAGLGLGYRRLRRLEDDLPDAVVGATIPASIDAIQAEADLQFGLATGTRGKVGTSP